MAGEYVQSDSLDGREGPQVAAEAAAVKGTAAWWRQRRMDPVSDTCRLTVLTVSMWIASLKSMFRMSDVVVDMWCRFVHYLLLPDGNMFPPSFHLVKAVLAVPDVSSVTRHVCPQCWTLFPGIKPCDHTHHLDDVCNTPGCTQKRFEVDLAGKGAPCRSVFYFGEAASLKDLILQPGVLAAVRAHRVHALTDPAGFWQSPAGRALNAACGGIFAKADPDEIALLFSLGALGLSSAYPASLSCQAIDIVWVQWGLQ